MNYPLNTEGYCSEERYIGETKWTIFKLKVLSFLGNKKAKKTLYYIYLDYYYWWRWQKRKREIINDLTSSTLETYSTSLVNWIMEDN